jgi:hypothetical protein
MGRKKRTKIEEAPSEPTPAMIAPDLPPPPVFAPPPAIPPQPPIDPRVDVKENSMVQIKSASIKKVPNVELGELLDWNYVPPCTRSRRFVDVMVLVLLMFI